MSFLSTFVREIASSWSGATLSFGQPSGPTKPYIVILVVPPNSETPQVFAEDEGDGGELVLQFSCAADSPQEALNELESLKAVVRAIRGLIGSDDYRISANRCTGVQQFDASLGTWQATFDSTVVWSAT